MAASCGRARALALARMQPREHEWFKPTHYLIADLPQRRRAANSDSSLLARVEGW